MKSTLAEMRSKWRIPAALAVTIESGRVAVDHVRRENGGSRVLRSLSLPLGSEQVLEDPERAGRDLAALIESSSIREKRCVVCVPPGWALSAVTELPEVTGEDLRTFLALRAEREFPWPADDLNLAHSRYVVPGGKSRATLAAIPTRRLEAVRRMLATAGCRPVSISLGLDHCLADELPQSPGRVHVLVNGTHVDLVVTAGGGVVALRSLAGPASSAPGEAAPPEAGLGRELRITMGRLPEPVRQQIQEARFAGRSASVQALFEASLEPLGRLGLRAERPSRTAMPDDDASAKTPGPGAAVQAAERHLQGLPVLFEFVAPETSRLQTFLRRFDTRRHRWLAVIVFAVVVLPLAAIVVRSQIERGLRARWTRMQPAVTELEGMQNEIRQFRPWFGTATPALAIFAELVAAFPETGEVWAKSVEITDNSAIDCSGFARNQSAWMDFLDRLRAQPGVNELQVKSVRGENPVQFSFSYNWKQSHDE